MYRLLFNHVFLRLDAERAHRIGMGVICQVARVPLLRTAIQRNLTPRAGSERTSLFGRDLAGPFGLAAGFDKNAVGVRGLTMLGFTFIEVGTVTAHPQPGNEPPRLWRVLEQRAVRNKMGFNNEGAVAVATRLRRLRGTLAGRQLAIGANLGKSKITPVDEAAGDYATSASLLAPWVDYLVVNVSSPNTPGLRSLQAVEHLRPILLAVRAAADEATGTVRVPLLVKIAPDLSDEDVDAVADLAVELGLDGVVAVNTTTAHDLGEGGLSGPPLLARGLAVVRRLRERLGGDATILGVGGITTADDARSYLTAGADAVQGYTGFLYEGPFWAARINCVVSARATR